MFVVFRNIHLQKKTIKKQMLHIRKNHDKIVWIEEEQALMWKK